MTKRNDPPDPDDLVDLLHAENLLAKEEADAADLAEHAVDSAEHAEHLAADRDEEKSLEKNS